MLTREVEVRHIVKVTIDETKFDAEFMEEFRRYFFQFDTLDEHLEHLAQLYARGVFELPSEFVEGYGPAKDMGIKCATAGFETEVLAAEAIP